jgi:hypothetical protein
MFMQTSLVISRHNMKQKAVTYHAFLEQMNHSPWARTSAGFYSRKLPHWTLEIYGDLVRWEQC